MLLLNYSPSRSSKDSDTMKHIHPQPCIYSDIPNRTNDIDDLPPLHYCENDSSSMAPRHFEILGTIASLQCKYCLTSLNSHRHIRFLSALPSLLESAVYLPCSYGSNASIDRLEMCLLVLLTIVSARTNSTALVSHDILAGGKLVLWGGILLLSRRVLACAASNDHYSFCVSLWVSHEMCVLRDCASADDSADIVRLLKLVTALCSIGLHLGYEDSLIVVLDERIGRVLDTHRLSLGFLAVVLIEWTCYVEADLKRMNFTRFKVCFESLPAQCLKHDTHPHFMDVKMQVNIFELIREFACDDEVRLGSCSICHGLMETLLKLLLAGLFLDAPYQDLTLTSVEHEKVIILGVTDYTLINSCRFRIELAADGLQFRFVAIVTLAQDVLHRLAYGSNLNPFDVLYAVLRDEFLIATITVFRDVSESSTQNLVGVGWFDVPE